MITVSTDGSCLRNPGGAIGWAWVNHDGTSASGGARSGTNQVAELMAVLEAVLAHPGDEPLRVVADSQYAIKCASEWLPGWKRKGWRTAGGGPVQNLGLVQAIDRAITDRTGPVTFGWVRGHTGDRFNERADELAGVAARAAREGTLPAGTMRATPVLEPVGAAPARRTRAATATGTRTRAATTRTPAATAPGAPAASPAAPSATAPSATERPEPDVLF
ncbi:ribonuclease H family protein [Cellulomonas shaoxiangyii]|uniref:ribonuclease H family protein n=1 Tax=Cellulomonas shaoxiangyii TaxID=2566013 RepID=UPI001FB79FF8|nr:ribonuclease H [Cellulomonas shaoxiangyii]